MGQSPAAALSSAQTARGSRTAGAGADTTRSPHRHRQAAAARHNGRPSLPPAVARSANRRHLAAAARPRRGAAQAVRATTGSRNRVARPSAACRSWPTACGPPRAQHLAAACDPADRRPTEPPTEAAPRSAPPRAGSAETTAARWRGPARPSRSASGTRRPGTRSRPPPTAAPARVHQRPLCPRGTVAPPGHTHRTPCVQTACARPADSGGTRPAAPPADRPRLPAPLLAPHRSRAGTQAAVTRFAARSTSPAPSHGASWRTPPPEPRSARRRTALGAQASGSADPAGTVDWRPPMANKTATAATNRTPPRTAPTAPTPSGTTPSCPSMPPVRTRNTNPRSLDRNTTIMLNESPRPNPAEQAKRAPQNASST